jgi:hypothetical protein
VRHPGLAQLISGLRPSEQRRRAGVEDATRRLLLGCVLPLWIVSGLADWACHRRSDIEHTAGTNEALVHAAMMSQAGAPVLLGLFAEINAGVLAATLTALGAHQATAIWDVAYAESRREVTATEQHVHGLLEQVPVMATAFLLTLHWDQAKTLIPGSRQQPRFAITPKRNPVSARARASIIGLITLLGVIPYSEEIIRCRRADKTVGPHQPGESPLPDTA